MAILAVDSGTTSTRVWLMEDGGVAAGASAVVGARDALRRSAGELLTRIRQLSDEALARSGRAWNDVEALVAFGMITSERGLEEVEHLPVPVGRDELIRAAVRRTYADQIPRPVYLIPGVRCDGASLEETDFMRGEETEVMGLLEVNVLAPPFLYVSTGSHSKFAWVDDSARIERSMTTLSGELVWALHRETILSELVDPSGNVEDFDAVDAGAATAENGGLSRALFAARLLNRTRGVPPGSCSDFVHGAVAASDLRPLRSAVNAGSGPPTRVAIAGQGAFADVYRHLLGRESWVEEVLQIDRPLGAIGAWTLFNGVHRRQEAAR